MTVKRGLPRAATGIRGLLTTGRLYEHLAIGSDCLSSLQVEGTILFHL
jgi:hypothetical protein